MAYMGNLKKGDRVRVTIESEVAGVASMGLNLHDGHTWVNTAKEGVTVEKVEPPVETFKPGDVVRQRYGFRHVYFVRPKGFTNLTEGKEYDYPFEFTSEFYERVNFDSPTR